MLKHRVFLYQNIRRFPAPAIALSENAPLTATSLTWEQLAGATGYTVWYAPGAWTDTSGPFVVYETLGPVAFPQSDFSAAATSEYTWFVVAHYTGGDSAPSNLVSAGYFVPGTPVPPGRFLLPVSFETAGPETPEFISVGNTDTPPGTGVTWVLRGFSGDEGYMYLLLTIAPDATPGNWVASGIQHSAINPAAWNAYHTPFTLS